MKEIILYNRVKIILLILVAFSSLNLTAQSLSLPSEVLPLKIRESFNPVSGNWQIAGEVMMNRKKEQMLKINSGEGILVNIPGRDAAENLISVFEHGDIELDLEYMVPVGSGSGIYLQGRYELQLKDSWGKKSLQSSDAGGISAAWDEGAKKSFGGRPARVNVSRAPGLWQHLKIIFKAPRFDEKGNKIKNARFVKVVHNGVLIHENVEVSGPARGALFQDEKKLGSIMLEGGEGPVAFKNIRYKMFDRSPPEIANLQFRYYAGTFDKAEDFEQEKPKAEGRSEELSWNLGNDKNDFAYQFKGSLEIEKAGSYILTLLAGGSSSLIMDNKIIFTEQRKSPRDAIIVLDAGSHHFTLTYFKKDQWIKPALGLFIEGPGFPLHALHAVSSLPDPEPVSPVFVQPLHEPIVLRGFIEHSGKKKTHVVSVGEPGYIHYAVDLQQGALIKIWKGEFVDATGMWHSRGHSQLMVPLGSVIELSGAPAIAALKDRNSPWPDSLAPSQIQIKGYELNEERRPTFQYLVENTIVEDFLIPENDQRSLSRTITLSKLKDGSNLWIRIAEGQQIFLLEKGTYGINNGEYYIHLENLGKSKAIIRNNKKGQELLFPISANAESYKLKYTLSW